MADKKKPDYKLAFTHLQNNQNITAYNLFLDLAENQKKIDGLKAALLFTNFTKSNSKNSFIHCLHATNFFETTN